MWVIIICVILYSLRQLIDFEKKYSLKIKINIFILVLFKISTEKLWIYQANYGILYVPNKTK